MKKKELCFIIGILLTALLLWSAMHLMRSGSYTFIRISVDGETYGTYSLSENQVISIGNTNVCEIKNGEVTMIKADCSDHLCMKQKAVTDAGGTIVCLPNKVVIEGEKAADSKDSSADFDAAT